MTHTGKTSHWQINTRKHWHLTIVKRLSHVAPHVSNIMLCVGVFRWRGNGTTHFHTAFGNRVQDRLTHMANGAWDIWNRNTGLMFNQTRDLGRLCRKENSVHRLFKITLYSYVMEQTSALWSDVPNVSSWTLVHIILRW